MTSFPEASAQWETIQKLRRLVKDAARFIANGQTPEQPFADLDQSIHLQTLLNSIESTALTIGPAQYVLGATRPILTDLTDDSNLERLG
ncbi:MAG: hypothetical protein LBV61_08205 [Burkholderiaceae bacterium]|jgi:hypothetical protein|nr:hypothetical protein [Burkholderiaceae bacterium]